MLCMNLFLHFCILGEINNVCLGTWELTTIVNKSIINRF